MGGGPSSASKESRPEICKRAGEAELEILSREVDEWRRCGLDVDDDLECRLLGVAIEFRDSGRRPRG